MPRTGPRPHVWLHQGQENHDQHIAWLRMRAQANHRGEIFLLTFEEFQKAWLGRWSQRGRAVNDYCLTREDYDGAWTLDNTICITRLDHLRRKQQIRLENER